jgi:hypothetical protein
MRGRTQLDGAGGGEKDVGSFDITMDLAFLMKVIKAEKQFSTDDGDLLFVKNAWFELQ